MSPESFDLSACPNCGSPDLRKIRGDWAGNYRGETYTVKDLVYFACPACHEKIYPPAAIQKIREVSPAYSKRTDPRRAAPKTAA